jgi:hypothetical protein
MNAKLELAIRSTQEIMDLTPDGPRKDLIVAAITPCIEAEVKRDAEGIPMTPEVERALDYIISLGVEAKKVLGAAKAKLAAAQTTNNDNKQLN